MQCAVRGKEENQMESKYIKEQDGKQTIYERRKKRRNDKEGKKRDDNEE